MQVSQEKASAPEEAVPGHTTSTDLSLKKAMPRKHIT